MDTPLKHEFEYFLEHQADLAKRYGGQFIVIKDRRVLGAYPDQLRAVLETAKRHEIGTFLVQKADTGPEAYTRTFHSHVVHSA